MKMINLAENKKKRFWKLSQKEREGTDPNDVGDPVQIIGILSSKKYQMIQTGEAYIEIPDGTSMTNQSGSKELVFSCDDEIVANTLIEGLDNSGIPWYEDFETEEASLGDTI